MIVVGIMPNIFPVRVGLLYLFLLFYIDFFQQERLRKVYIYPFSVKRANTNINYWITLVVSSLIKNTTKYLLYKYLPANFEIMLLSGHVLHLLERVSIDNTNQPFCLLQIHIRVIYWLKTFEVCKVSV